MPMTDDLPLPPTFTMLSDLQSGTVEVCRADAVRAYGVEHNIVTEGWSPIARGKVLGDPVVLRIARATGAHPAQVVLRWHIERGDVVFPKSVHPQRMKDNFEIFDFEINDEEIEALTALDKGEAGRQGPNPDTFAYIPD